VKPGALTALLKQVVGTPEQGEVEPPSLFPGTVVGRFEVVREVGRGGFGVVYEARDRELGRQVALKIIRPGTASLEEGRVAREAEAIARLAHPNLITLYDVGRSDGRPYLVFEFLRGRTLQEQIEAGPLTVQETVHIATEVARGLAHAHAEGVVHRDLKPSNVFVTSRGQVKILDFGMAHAFGRRPLSGGTPAYMAPEQWDDDPEDERTDVFSLGVMLYRMLSETYPFPKGDGRWSAGSATAPRLNVPGTPGLADLVARMLDRTPKGRPRDGAAVLAALTPIEDALRTRPASTVEVRGTADGTPTTQPSLPKARLGGFVAELKRRRVLRALAGYGLAAVALLLAVEPVKHGLDLPDWVLMAVVVGLGFGLPVTFLLAWTYDLTATGIERTRTTGGRSGRLAPALVAVGLILVAPLVIWYLVDRGHGTGAGASRSAALDATGPSVAVLPFVNISGDPENEYFSDGLSEEILNALAQVPGLRVPARTSSFFFKGKTQDVARIAQALRVATLLEGSVRKAGGRVRITAQLVNAADGYHLWSQTFERELKDVFAVQDEIATAIAGALKLRLAPTAAAGSKKPGSTASPEAYEAYLLGRHALNERTRASIEQAVFHLQKAVAVDPAFAVAWADAAVAVMLLSQSSSAYGDIPLPQALARARPLLEKARALAPDRPEVLAAAGFIEAGAGQPERALEFYDRALALNPNSGEVQNWRKIALEALGRYEQVLPALADAVRSDPLSKVLLLAYIEALQRFGREAEVSPVLDRLRNLDEAWGLQAQALLAGGRGDRAEAIRFLLPALQQGRHNAAGVLAWTLADVGLREEALNVGRDELLGVYLTLGEYPRALELARAAVGRNPDDPDAQYGLFFALYGSRRQAEAAPLAAQLLRASQGDDFTPGFLLLMADATRTAGRAAEAASYRDLASRRLERLQRAGVVPRNLAPDLARLAAYDGRDDESVGLLFVVLPAVFLARAELEFPIFSRLLRRPDYRAVLARLDAALAGQRARVVEMLCGPRRLSATWQPAPETCDGAPPAR